MCGLVAVFDRSGRPVDDGLVLRMRDTIVHRGPDDAGLAHPAAFPTSSTTTSSDDGTDPTVALGSRRLAILDLSAAGHMPMVSADGRMMLAYNGEIYNFATLRAELEAEGVSFRSRTDTEVVLEGLARHGPAYLERLVGMFALAAWDARSQSLLLARDPAGKKPLYTAWAGDRLYVASEIKALLCAPELTRAIDPVALQQYMTLQFVLPPRTLFAGIGKLAPGEAMVVPRAGEVRRTRFWQPYGHVDRDRDWHDHARLVSDVRDALDRAVAERMVADVPIGAYLSGGLDSSLVVALMQRHTDRAVDAFTITYPEHPDADERAFAQIAADHTGARLHTVPVTEANALDGLDAYAWHADVPIADPAAVNAFWTSHGLRTHGVVVALVGEGADELFFGYPGYFQYQRMARLWRANRWLPRPLRRLEGAALAWAMARTGRARHADVARRLVDLDTMFLTHETGFDLPEVAGLLGATSPTLSAGPSAGHAVADLQAGFSAATGGDTLKLVSTTDLMARVAEKLLMRVDKMSMAHSLEARAPFMDRRLIDLVLPIPGDLRGRAAPGRAPETKGLLRAVAEPLLPPEIIRRPKMGFQPPIGHWLATSLGDRFTDIIAKGRIFADGILRPEPCKALLAAHRAGGGRHQVKLWNVMSLALWYERFGVNGVVGMAEAA